MRLNRVLIRSRFSRLCFSPTAITEDRMLRFVKKLWFDWFDILKCPAFSEWAGTRVLWLES